jgi:hypothetical protein
VRAFGLRDVLDRHVDHDQLGVLQRLHDEGLDIADRRAVPGFDPDAVDLDAPARRNQITAPVLAQLIDGALTRLKRRAEYAGVGAYRQGFFVGRNCPTQRNRNDGNPPVKETM